MNPEIKEKKVKELKASLRYSNNVNAREDSLSELDKFSEILINAFKEYSLFFSTIH